VGGTYLIWVDPFAGSPYAFKEMCMDEFGRVGAWVGRPAQASADELSARIC
jgi:hypothetical protein